MTKRLALFALLLSPSLAHAETLLAVPAGGAIVVRAASHEVAAIDLASLRPAWAVSGVADPRILTISQDGRWAAAIDPVANQLALVDLSRRTGSVRSLPETPIAAHFLGDALFVLSRDARLVSRFDLTREDERTAQVPAGASHLATGEAGVIVYSALTGEASRLDPATLQPLAMARLPRFASDLETDQESGYLALPRSGRLVAFNLASLAVEDDRAIAAVAMDIAIESEESAARATRIAVADPSSKRVWRDEGPQSTGEAFGRGFLRGLLGLGLYTPRSASFPTGVDRITESRGRLLAFDSSSGTVYALDGERATRLATGVAWGGFAIEDNVMLVARGTSLERIALPR